MGSENSIGSIDAAIKYNPHLWGPEELRAIFVVRKTDLKTITDAVRTSNPANVAQHMLICGNRGMGKSTLLRRIALEIKETPDLSKNWLAINFPEEQYTVRTLGEFLLNVLDALADTLEQTNTPADVLAKLDVQIQSIAGLADNEVEKAALAFLNDWVQANSRGLVLLVDSSDMLLRSLAEGENKLEDRRSNASALWRLRKVLSHQNGLLWIGTSYQALEVDAQYQDAFHDFFVIHELIPLDVEEMRLALLALARQFGIGRGLKAEAAEAEMARLLESRPERLKTLRLLSGGNPRTMVTLYELFAAGGDDSIQSDLKRLLDIMTPLYKARMEVLSDQPRKIFAHMMENWNPIGVRELAVESGIPTSTISGQLVRLEIEGLIEKTQLGTTVKRSGYQVTERFFNVWYLMRYGTRRLRQRLQWAIQFMQMWFSREDLSAIAGSRTKRHSVGELNEEFEFEFSRAVAAALGATDYQSTVLELEVLRAAHSKYGQVRQNLKRIIPETLFDLDGSDSHFSSVADYLNRLSALDEKLALCAHVPESELTKFIHDVKGSLTFPLTEKENVAKQLSTAYSDVSQYLELKEIFAREKLEFKAHLGDSYEAVTQAIVAGQFFPDFPESKQGFFQMTSILKGHTSFFKIFVPHFLSIHKDEWAERLILEMINRNPGDPSYHDALAHLNHHYLGRSEVAELAYRKAINLDDKYFDSYVGLGSLLHQQLKRYDEAEVAYRQAIAIDKTHYFPCLSLGNLLQLNPTRYGEAEDVYRLAIQIDEKKHLSWLRLGDFLDRRLERYDEAAQAFRKAIELSPEDVLARLALGNLLRFRFGEFREAEEIYLHATALNNGSADAWNSLGNLWQDQFKLYDKAAEAYRHAIKLAPKSAASYCNLGRLFFNHLKNNSEAEKAFKNAIDVDETHAESWNGYANTLSCNRTRLAEAESAFLKAIALDPLQSVYVANLAQLKVGNNKVDEANFLYRQVLNIATKDDDHIKLQANLWLGNFDFALNALDTLSSKAHGGSNLEFFAIREQCWECSRLGLASKLSELIARSAWADFLLPFRLALDAFASGNKPTGAAPEFLNLAEEILLEIRSAIGTAKI